MISKTRVSLIAMLIALVVAVSNSGCGGASPAVPISVNAFSSAQTIDESRSASITATVANDTASKGVTWSLTGTACAGSACGMLSNQTGTSATYTAPSPVAANLSVKVVATSVADNTKSAVVSLTVVPPPSVTTTSLPGGTGGNAYTATLQESGGVAPFSWSITSGALPTGFALGSDGTISGKSCTGGTSNFAVQVADSANPPLTASAPLSISVTVLPLSIMTTSLPGGVTDAIYSQAVQVAGGISPYTWGVASGSLPSWAALNSSTGKITGIPGTTGTANFTLQVADSECSSVTTTQALSISVVSNTTASDSELSGHYAFLFNGFDDATGSQVAVAGSFTTDGKGNITAGIEDENGPHGSALTVPLTGTYNIGSDNRGAFTITTANGSKTYALALNSISSGMAHKGRFVEFDDTTGTSGQRGSGLLRLQDTAAFSLSSITGPYAFGFSGQNSAGNREAIVGAFNTDGAGTISSGVADQNVTGTATNPSLTGTYTAPSGSDGRAFITLNPSGASSLNLAAYVVSASELLVMRTDTFSSDGLLSGTILAQASTSFDNTALSSPSVYYQLGVDSASPSQSSAQIGLMTPDGKGGVTFNADFSRGSTIQQNQTFPETYSVLNAGRVKITSTQASAAWILYLINKNQAFLLDTSSDTGFGFVEPQAAAPSGGFVNSSFSGAFSAATVAPSISANVNATGLATLDGSGNFSESASASTLSGLFVNQTTTGAYSVGGNGRGTVTSLVITTASVGGSVVALLLLLWLLLGRLISRRNPSRRTLALFGVAVLIAPTLAGCPPPHSNEFVFYMISPTKAVMIHEASSDTTPGITILEQ
jgi:putative Ig domain-containing protein